MEVESVESSAEHGHGDHTFAVRVIYNGLTERIAVLPTETMGVLRERAVAAFGTLPAPHTLSLFTEAGVEYGPDRDQVTVADAGLKRNEKLLLRPSAVRGGHA